MNMKKRFIIELKRFSIQSYLYYKGRRAAFNAEEFICFQIFYPLMTLIFYCLIAGFSFNTNNLASWVIGNSFLLCTNSCIFGTGTVFSGERYNGRLRSIIAAPCSKFLLIVANGVFPALTAIISSTIGLVVGVVVFKVDFSKVNIPLTALTIIVAMISASGFGLLISMYGMISDSLFLVLNIASNVIMIFTGAEFPVSQLPKAFRVFSEILPLTKALKAQNILLKGSSIGKDFYINLSLELLTGVLYIFLAWILLGFAEKQARKNGRFDLY